MHVRFLLSADVALRAVSARSQCCSSTCASVAVYRWRASVPSGSTVMYLAPSDRIMLTVLAGVMLVVIWIGLLFPRDGRGFRLRAL